MQSIIPYKDLQITCIGLYHSKMITGDVTVPLYVFAGASAAYVVLYFASMVGAFLWVRSYMNKLLPSMSPRTVLPCQASFEPIDLPQAGDNPDTEEEEDPPKDIELLRDINATQTLHDWKTRRGSRYHVLDLLVSRLEKELSGEIVNNSTVERYVDEITHMYGLGKQRNEDMYFGKIKCVGGACIVGVNHAEWWYSINNLVAEGNSDAALNHIKKFREITDQEVEKTNFSDNLIY